MESSPSPEFGLRDAHRGKPAPGPQVWPRRPSFFWGAFILLQAVILWRTLEAPGLWIAFGVAAAAFYMRGLWPMSRRAWHLWSAPFAIIGCCGIIYCGYGLLKGALV
ncbi:hypothetical protein [Hyphomonas chukchiensis]|uniref:Uncharacterized protein n=1 Tax=Hyphomonas chukchiensis TaxID=1280947 RepID=A0A062ULZ4_9PROT|nr:hypothetical protein [Hyphomonas chukchiensis]KCZ59941.1 hypothetical protein HY30_13000 [Hyphomonas chukchiensis]